MYKKTKKKPKKKTKKNIVICISFDNHFTINFILNLSARMIILLLIYNNFTSFYY